MINLRGLTRANYRMRKTPRVDRESTIRSIRRTINIFS
jgi:hypothetical protein